MAPTASILTFTSSQTTCGDGHRLTLKGMPTSTLPKDCPAGMTWRSSASGTYTYPNESKTLEWPRGGVSMTDDRFPLGNLGKYFKWKVIENNQSRLEADLTMSFLAGTAREVDTVEILQRLCRMEDGIAEQLCIVWEEFLGLVSSECVFNLIRADLKCDVKSFPRRVSSILFFLGMAPVGSTKCFPMEFSQTVSCAEVRFHWGLQSA
ncbi:hypothetical protein C8R43DRAFT_961422 [Mycena crocata]|nr:hypothetical protein C8R43DRAFT_961422 [Mycena crocata]